MVDTIAGQHVPNELVDGFHSGIWIWTPEMDINNAPQETIAFRRTYTPPAGKYSSSALVLIPADSLFSLSINGQFAGVSEYN